jgi:hypothetical protein
VPLCDPYHVVNQTEQKLPYRPMEKANHLLLAVLILKEQRETHPGLEHHFYWQSSDALLKKKYQIQLYNIISKSKFF